MNRGMVRLRFDFIKYLSDILDYYVLYTIYIYTTYRYNYILPN